MSAVDEVAHKILVDLSGLRPGQLVTVLAGRLAAIKLAHRRSDALSTHCRECCELWPCDTFGIANGEVDA